MRPDFEIGPPLDAKGYGELVERAAQECFKWNLAGGDHPILAPFPITLRRSQWMHLAELAESLDREARLAEQELLERPELYELLGVPEATAACLSGAGKSSAPRYTRFDFHVVGDGLRITESNCDVAGGLLEASGVSSIYCDLVDFPRQLDPALAYARAFRRAFGEGARIGLAHLSSYTEDRQVALYLAHRLSEHGLVSHLVEPAQLRPGLRAVTPHGLVTLDAVYRFFPGDWLERLPRATGWPELFESGRVSNPLTTLLIQSKRFPLVWPKLRAALPTWQHLLPLTISPESVTDADGSWVLKPAFGHEGAGVICPSPDQPPFSASLRRVIRRSPHRWVAQRKFEMVPVPTPIGSRFLSIGVFVVDGVAAGSYARLGAHPVLDDRSQEAVVLVEAT
jgi:glutathionylspermidine synthase